ncbi:oxygenase MpaB family protein [Ralstonia pseudosolanacearum]|uniref:oxygenase MpaB family protein n=1 Tax=Ralstonia pseudosolanacearum TaxID=1310165 RepID=UPI003CF5DBB8
MHTPLTSLRERIVTQVRGMTRASGGLTLDIASPPGDPGLFGPDAVCWQVHADFPSMMAGGVSALLLQALHPRALAGIWDHSSFRDDLQGRLGRTAQFVAGTTYGSRRDALALIERVKAIHSRVHGIAPDGRPYSANDPDLLTWVHVAEISSFLAGYLRYVDAHLSGDRQDRYFEETALVAMLLGARDVPTSRAAVQAYLNAMRAELVASDRTRTVVEVLMSWQAPRPSLQPAVRMFLDAGIQLLPPWALTMLALEQPTLRAAFTTAAMRTLAPTLRWALREGSVAYRARRRALAPCHT